VTEPIAQVLDPIEFDERDGQRKALSLRAGLLDAETLLETCGGLQWSNARRRSDLLLELEDASGQCIAFVTQLLKLGAQGTEVRQGGGKL
jgi:hypothetical protein